MTWRSKRKQHCVRMAHSARNLRCVRRVMRRGKNVQWSTQLVGHDECGNRRLSQFSEGEPALSADRDAAMLLANSLRKNNSSVIMQVGGP